MSALPTVQLGDLRWRCAWISEIGCLDPCARHLGRELTRPWLFGGTGYAFLLNIHAELCPCGRHCANFASCEQPWAAWGERALEAGKTSLRSKVIPCHHNSHTGKLS